MRRPGSHRYTLVPLLCVVALGCDARPAPSVDGTKRMADTLRKIEKRAAAYPEILPTSSRTGFGMPELRAGIAKLLSERGAG